MELQKSKFLNSLVNWQKFGNATQVSIQKNPIWKYSLRPTLKKSQIWFYEWISKTFVN